LVAGADSNHPSSRTREKQPSLTYPVKTGKRTEEAHLHLIYCQDNLRAMENKVRAERVYQSLCEKAEGRYRNLSQMFRRFDQDKTGELEFPEFSRACKELDPALPEEDIRLVFDLADSNGDNFVTFQEFSRIVHQPVLAQQNELKEFQKGKLTKTQIRKGQQRYKKIEANKLKLHEYLMRRQGKKQNYREDGKVLMDAFQRMDLNNDGMVSIHEFNRAVGPEGLDLGLSVAEIEDIFRLCDDSLDGQMQLGEFLHTFGMDDVDPEYNPLFKGREAEIHALKNMSTKDLRCDERFQAALDAKEQSRARALLNVSATKNRNSPSCRSNFWDSGGILSPHSQISHDSGPYRSPSEQLERRRQKIEKERMWQMQAPTHEKTCKNTSSLFHDLHNAITVPPTRFSASLPHRVMAADTTSNMGFNTKGTALHIPESARFATSNRAFYDSRRRATQNRREFDSPKCHMSASILAKGQRIRDHEQRILDAYEFERQQRECNDAFRLQGKSKQRLRYMQVVDEIQAKTEQIGKLGRTSPFAFRQRSASRNSQFYRPQFDAFVMNNQQD